MDGLYPKNPIADFPPQKRRCFEDQKKHPLRHTGSFTRNHVLEGPTDDS